MPGLICVSFTTFGVASDPRCAGVGAGRLDDIDIILISECSSSTGLTFPAGDCPQLDIGVPDRDLSTLTPRSWAEVIQWR
jgi:hypothetical protein